MRKTKNKENKKKYIFTDDDIKFLKEYYPKREWELIEQRFPNVDKQLIYNQMSILNISLQKYFWDKKDIQILKDKYLDMYGCVNDLVDMFNGRYTYSAIISKARKLGLKTRMLWNNDEIQILIDNYSKHTLDEMILLLPLRNRNSIIHKAISLGLKNKIIIEERFSDNEKQFILKHYNELTDVEIGKVLSRNASSINDYRCRNGLKKLYENSSYNDLSEYVRINNSEWKKNSIINCDYKCVLSGKRFDDIHHIYGLNLILDEVLCELKISVKETMDDYSEKELKLILGNFRLKQAHYPLGVCLTKEIHKQFHAFYGYGNNTQEQWDEFVSDYKIGKYKNVA